MTQIDSAAIAAPQAHTDDQAVSFEYINPFVLELEDEGFAYDGESLKSSENDGGIYWVILRISEDIDDRRDYAGYINIELIDVERVRAELGLVYDQFYLISSWLSLRKAKQENKSPASVAGGTH